MRKLIILTALLLAPAVSQAKTLEELLVDKGVITKGEAAGSTASNPGKVYWNDGTRFEFPDNGFTAQINTLLQTRYTFFDNPGSASNSSSFDVQTARLIASGTALNEEFSYKLEGDFVGNSSGDSKGTELDDAYLEWHACDWASVRMGQFKTAVSRQFNSNEWQLQMPDRSLASNYFNLDYQDGIAGNSTWADGMVELGAGIFNGNSDGEGKNRSGNDSRVMGQVNLRVNATGKMDVHEEGDVNYTEESAVSLGAVYAHTSANRDLGNGVERAGLNDISVDANWKYQGMSLHGEYFVASQDNDISEEADPQGFYVQGGYFLDPKTWELAARYSMVDCDDGKAPGSCSGNDSLNEAGVSINYYWWKHNLKAQLAYLWMDMNLVGPDGDAETNSNKWILQLASYF